jgi:hypothetical protein
MEECPSFHLYEFLPKILWCDLVPFAYDVMDSPNSTIMNRSPKRAFVALLLLIVVAAAEGINEDDEVLNQI